MQTPHVSLIYRPSDYKLTNFGVGFLSHDTQSEVNPKSKATFLSTNEVWATIPFVDFFVCIAYL